MENLIISVSGIRGTVGKSLEPAFFSKFSSAFGTFVNGGKVVIGRDTRKSGEMLKSAIVSGLLATGCQVLDSGICPTPTNLFNANRLQADGAITITASHNPIEWNGIELAKAHGNLLEESDRVSLMEIFESEKIKLASWDKVGSVVEIDDAVDQHIKKILSLPYIDHEIISQKNPKVVIDCVNGAGSVISPRLLNCLGCEVTELYCKTDGDFQREPEPNPINLEKLSELVIKEKADIGFAHDADADRLTIVTEKGEALSGEYTLALAADFMLKKNAHGKNRAIVVNISTSRIIDDIAQKHQANVYRSKVGCGHVVQKMREKNALIGGEGTGGVIFPDVHYTTDGITCLALFAQMLAESELPLSAMVDSIPKYFMTKKKLKIDSPDIASKMLEKFIKKNSDEELDFTDGVKIVYENSWVIVRKSGTEPVIRIFSEAPNQQKSESLCEKAIKQLEW